MIEFAVRMAHEGQQRRQSKRERQQARQRAGRRRKLRSRLLRGGGIALLLLLLGLWQLDRLGAEEVIDAEVVASKIWSHRGTDGRIHTHQRVTLEIEGLMRATIDRGDELEKGAFVPVRIRRGRLSGRAYFLGREAVEAEPEGGAPAEDVSPVEEEGAAPLEEPG